MTRNVYSRGINNTNWELLESQRPAEKPGGNHSSVDIREIANAIFYLLRKNCYSRTLNFTNTLSGKIIGILKKVVKPFKDEMVYTKRQIVGLVKDHRDYLGQPRNEFTLEGYEIIQDFLDKDECERLIQVANRYLLNKSYLIEENCYLVCRQDIRDVDSQVQQIINAQKVDDKLSQLFSSHIIEEMFERRIGEKLQLQSITIQVDNPDTQSKRGFHSDGVTPPVYKAFIYLNDVDDYGDGPYTVIPGSHRHTFQKIINYVYRWVITLLSRGKIHNRKLDDRRLFYSDKQSVSIFGKAGTLIISNQQLAHKGWHKHDKKKRYALICYLMAERHHSEPPFKLWRAVIDEKLRGSTLPEQKTGFATGIGGTPVVTEEN